MYVMYPLFLLLHLTTLSYYDSNTNLFPQAETQLLIPENDAVLSPPEDQLGLDTQPNAKTAFLLSIDELLSAVSSLPFFI